MTRNYLFLIITFFVISPAFASGNLTGIWKGDDGGVYFIRQVKDRIYWYGRQLKSRPNWTNVFSGRLKGTRIKGDWADVPFGGHLGSGKMVLSIDACGNLIFAKQKHGGSFGANSWKRLTNKGAYQREGALCNDKIDNYDDSTDPLSKLGLFDSDCLRSPRKRSPRD
jgi:hypothetical protein